MLNKKWLVFLTLTVLLFNTTGCAQYTIDITEQQDGSALCEYRLGFNPVILRLISTQGVNPLADWQQQKLAQGFTVRHWQQAGWFEYIAHRRVENIAELNPFDSFLLPSGETVHPFKIDSSIFFNRLELQQSIDLSGLGHNLSPSDSQLMQRLLKDVKIQFTYHTQRHILQHNADMVQQDGDNYSLSWFIVPGKNNEIMFTAQRAIVRHVVGLGMLGAIAVYYIVMANMLWRRVTNNIGEEQQQKVPCSL